MAGIPGLQEISPETNRHNKEGGIFPFIPAQPPSRLSWRNNDDVASRTIIEEVITE